MKCVYYNPTPQKGESPLFVLVKAEKGWKPQPIDNQAFSELARQTELCDEDGARLVNFDQALKLAWEKHVQKRLRASR
jgi:hypothetical protein